MAIIACYCRVSTRHQKNDGQKAEIERWLRNHAIDMATVRWFEDKESGTVTHRLAFDEMQKGLFEGNIRTVVVWKLDRLSRRLRDGMNLLADWCERGVRVVAVTQQIDLSGPVGHMLASVMFGLAEIELEYRRERQAAGIEVARKNDVYKGRRRGTTKARPVRVKELHDQGLTVSEIANAMAVSRRTVFRYLAEAKDYP
ncbi:MAG: recombinase family protein [Candidatus Competibacteraceae bacterium]|nr:recombinase family protein [Candidatus Competibacteraceae bacterium]